MMDDGNGPTLGALETRREHALRQAFFAEVRADTYVEISAGEVS
jgi:hypothetical protein